MYFIYIYYIAMSLLLIMRTIGLVHNFTTSRPFLIHQHRSGEMLGAAPELPDDDSSDDDDLSNRGRSDAFNSSL